jgi:hypothetical protein
VAFCSESHPELFGITDGKAVGTYIESRFKAHLRAAEFFVEDEDEGSAAKGIDLPGLATDIKVTSLRQPQSSAPFKHFRQKIEGLGYNLVLFVQTTKYLRHLLLEQGADVEDLIAYLQDRNVPADEVSLASYAESLMSKPPEQGYLTISNALQWRLQYKRVVTQEIPGVRNVFPT